MSQRLIPVLRQAVIYTCITLTPAILWTFNRTLSRSTEEQFITWAERSGALMMSSDGLDRWWSILVAPLLHHNAHHLISNAVMIMLSALILTVISTPQRQLQTSSHNLQLKGKRLIWMYLTVYVGASIIAFSRLSLGHLLGITQGSMGLSGGTLFILSSLCVRVAITPDLIGVNLKVTPRSAQVLIRCLWMSIPPLLLVVNQGSQIDEWSHYSGWIVGSCWGGVVWRTEMSMNLLERDRIMYVSMMCLCVLQSIAIYLCLTTAST